MILGFTVEVPVKRCQDIFKEIEDAMLASTVWDDATMHQLSDTVELIYKAMELASVKYGDECIITKRKSTIDFDTQIAAHSSFFDRAPDSDLLYYKFKGTEHIVVAVSFTPASDASKQHVFYVMTEAAVDWLNDVFERSEALPCRFSKEKLTATVIES